MIRSGAFRLICATIAGIAALPCAAIAQAVAPPNCFDVLVSARVVRQVPSVYPECEDCIIMVWPWFVDLKVGRVLQGSLPRGRLRVLTLQHTYYRSDLGSRHWYLRRNTEGGFNVVRLEDGERPTLCAKETPPARPHIRPGVGASLDDLMREGERRYGARP